MEATTEESLSLFRKATTTGFTSGTGVVSYDLSGIVRQIPIVTPFRDIVARVKSSDGNKQAVWRAFLNVNNAQPSPVPGLDFAGAQIEYQEQDFQSPYVPIALGTSVTQDAYDLGQGYVDLYAEGNFQLLNQVLLAEDKVLMGAQSYALATPGTMTLSNATTGGSLAASTAVHVAVAPRTGYNYFYGGNGQAQTGTITPGSATSTNVVTASVAAVKGAVAYDWFYSADGSTWFYYSTTTVASVSITQKITVAQAVSNLVDISTTAPTVNTSADNGSFTTGSPNGMISSITGDYNTSGSYVTSGTSTANPGIFQDAGGAALALSGGSVSQIVTLFQSIYNQVKTSPTALMMNGLVAQEIANLILASNSATTFLQTDASGRVDVVAGGRVGSVINAIANTTVPIEVHPALPQGCIVARTDRVPFPQANAAPVLEVRTLRDYSLFDYGVQYIANTSGGGPRRQFEVRSIEAFINRVPSSMGMIANFA